MPHMAVKGTGRDRLPPGKGRPPGRVPGCATRPARRPAINPCVTCRNAYCDFLHIVQFFAVLPVA